ncbi:MAG: hypothetical protein HYY24_11865 [Verrucomicrobia bacterium]|nr:hypothetical protein [Verrucomicrobiota bacterium]
MKGTTARALNVPFWITVVLLSFTLFAGLNSVPVLAAADTAIRFRAVDVYVDSKEKPLAAYQLELSAKEGRAKIVGIEGGEHPAFKEPPFYDPKAMQQDRVIIAAFNTSPAGKLPKGKTRVATVHVQSIGDGQPEFAVKVETAGTVNGKKIKVGASFEERKAQ